MQELIEKIHESKRPFYPARFMASAAGIANSLVDDGYFPDYCSLQWVFMPPDPIENFLNHYKLDAKNRFEQILILWSRSEKDVSKLRLIAGLEALDDLKGARISPEFEDLRAQIRNYC